VTCGIIKDTWGVYVLARTHLLSLGPVPAGPVHSCVSRPVHSCVSAAGRFAAVCCVRVGGVPRDKIIIVLAPYPILISTSFRACSEYPPSDTYAARTHKPDCNHYRPTPHPRGYPPTTLHQPANNHPQTNNSAYPRALKRGGRRRRTPPTTTTTTIGNTSTRTQTNKAGWTALTVLNLSPRHQNYSTPPHHHHRGLPSGAATPPKDKENFHHLCKIPVVGPMGDGVASPRIHISISTSPRP